MFSKTIELVASKKEFRFADGMKEFRFRPIVFLAPEKKILAIGDAPDGVPASQGVDIFEDPNADAVALLESMFRYGMRSVLGGFTLRSVELKITIEPDIRADLKGFTTPIFHYAATQAGAVKVIV
jgi:hypothetical protein